MNAVSLVEIIVSMAIFAFIITIIIATSISLARAQQRVQAEMFLTQTAQVTIENISRNLRFGYAYSGTTLANYQANNSEVFIETAAVVSTSTATTTQLVQNVTKSPFVVFEAQGGDPTSYSDQNVYCTVGGNLYKISTFTLQSNATTYRQRCDNGESMLPDDVTLDYIYFDVYGQSSENPKNPMVRIRLKMSSELGGSVDLQTTVTQRLIQYF